MKEMNPYQPPCDTSPEEVLEPRRIPADPDPPHYLGRVIALLMVGCFIVAFALEAMWFVYSMS